MKLNKLFINYIVFYITIFLVPLILFVIFINYQYISTIDLSYRSEIQNVLDTTISTIDGNFAQLNRTALEISINDNIKPNYSLPSVSNAKTTITEAQKINSANSFIEKVIFHFNDDPFVYSNSGSAPIQIFEEYFLSKMNFAVQSNAMKEIVYAKYFPLDDYRYNVDSNPTKHILFVHSLCKYPNKKFGTLFCYISPDTITNILGDRDMIIYDTNGQLIFDSIALRTGNNEYSTQAYHKFQNDKIYKTVMLQKQKYYSVETTSKDTGLKYICLTNITGVEKSISKIRWNLLLFCIFISTLAAILIFFAMNKNYTPIQNLINYAYNLSGGEKAKNSLDVIKETIETLSLENGTLRSGSEKATNEYVMTLLLKGYFSSSESMTMEYRSLFQFDSDDKFVVCILFIHNSDSILSIPELERIGTRFFNNKHKNTYEKNKYIMIAWHSCLTNNNLATIFKQYNDAIFNEFGIETTFGIGTLCSTLKDISLSYLNAASALDYRMIKSDSIILYDDISNEKDDLDTLPYKELDELKKKLKQGMTSEVEQILFGILSYIKNCDLSLFLVRGFCFELISAIYQTTKNIDISLLPNNYNYTNYSLLAEFNTIDELSENVRNICHNICELVKTSKEFIHDTKINKMIDYIQSNYQNCDFSVQLMADYFEMTMTNISQYFKNHTNQNISDCVYYYRIEKAKELLMKNYKLTEISNKVGYYNVSSFTRRFKQCTGLSPKEFVKLNSKKS